jgi:large subunit ribosomal protein L2
MCLSDLQDGLIVNNIEIKPLKGSTISRSAGTSSQILKVNYNESGYSLIRLPSKEERLFDYNCIATIGQLSELNHFLLVKGKASINIFYGRRPVVRGVAMNRIDHPHGGGQGKTSGAGGQRSQVTFNSKVAKGQPTRRKKKKLIFVVFSRKKKYIKH